MASLVLIDDDEMLRRVLAKALRHAGHNVLEASDGQAGIEIIRAAPIDIVVTDLIMPVKEGVETILQLRREHPTLPVIAISGGATNSSLYLEIAGKMGAKRILAKPFTPRDLIQAIDEVLNETRASG